MVRESKYGERVSDYKEINRNKWKMGKGEDEEVREKKIVRRDKEKKCRKKRKKIIMG